MINFEKTKTDLNIEYSKGDSFALFLKAAGNLFSGSTVRMEISPSGSTDDILISKHFAAEETGFLISLSDDETSLLRIGEIYSHRFTFFDENGTKTTVISGKLAVKWGA